jgi:hypothetical protein
MTNSRFIDGRRAAAGILFSLILSFALSAGARADGRADGPPLVLTAGKGFVRLYSSWGRTNTFYRYDGELRLFDTVGTSYAATIFGVTGDYGLTDALELNVDIPVGYFSLTSESRFPSRSIFMPVYFGVGATYQLSRERLKTSVSTMIKVPSGFHRGIYDDPNHPTFLSDGYLQWTSMFNVGFTYKQIWMNGGVGYNFRDEEPEDEILYRLEFGFSRVEGTGIFAGVNGVLSTADAGQPARPFYAGASGPVDELERSDGGTGRFSTIDRENYFAITAGAFVDIMKNVRLDGRYSVRLFGKNSLNLQMASLGVGYTF